MDGILLATIGIYLVLATSIGTLMTSRARNAHGWTVASGGMSTTMVAFGVAGTRIGGAGTYGVAGDVISGGVWNLWWYGINAFLALAIVGLFFGIYYRRLKLHTVGELFSIRFGRKRCQRLTSLCVQTEYAIVNLIEAYVIAVILSTLTPLPLFGGVIVAAMVFASYVSLGGLWGTAITNVIHCTVVLVGLLAVGLIGIEHLGGWTTVVSTVDNHLVRNSRNAASWWQFTGSGWLPIFGMFFATVVHTPAASVYTNYSTAAKDERNIAPAFLLAGTIAALMPMLAGLIGILTAARYGLDTGLSGYRNLTTLATEISPVIGGVALAAVLAAVISSGGPILLSSATMIVRDWLPVSEQSSPRQQLKAYRITTTVYALAAALAAWIVATYTTVSILDLLLFGFAMVVPPAVSVAFLLYWRSTTEQGVYWGMLSGYAAGLVWFALTKAALVLQTTTPAGSESTLLRLVISSLTAWEETIDPSYLTFFIPLFVVPTVSLLTRSSVGQKAFYLKLSEQSSTEKDH